MILGWFFLLVGVILFLVCAVLDLAGSGGSMLAALRDFALAALALGLLLGGEPWTRIARPAT